MKDNLLISGHISTFSKRVDGSYKITFESQEWTNDGTLDMLQHEPILAFFSKKTPSKEAIEAIKESDISIKTKDKFSKSQILRFAIRDMWKRAGEIGDPEEYYRETMTKLIDFINNKQV